MCRVWGEEEQRQEPARSHDISPERELMDVLSKSLERGWSQGLEDSPPAPEWGGAARSRPTKDGYLGAALESQGPRVWVFPPPEGDELVCSFIHSFKRLLLTQISS